MLTKRQNLLETIRGGKPDRYVNQYEPFQILFANPYSVSGAFPQRGGAPVQNAWGVWIAFPEGVPGPFPVHDEEHILLKDITKWKDVVKAPNLDFPEEEWNKYLPMAQAIDRSEVFVTQGFYTGVFEQLHYLMSIDKALMNFIEEPEAMKELIDYITDWEVKYAREVCRHYHPDALFHHDDWGSQINSFLSPDMFNEFLTPAYKKIYGAWKEGGVEVVVHHSDSYAANLVPAMIEVGIDIFQGCVSTNNIPELIKKYGDKITFMGGIDNGKYDKADWTKESVMAIVRKVCEECGTKSFIPCATMGGPESTFPGAYDCVSECIREINVEKFGISG
ncbi:MAG: uroporphyrinogen decarboxylase [Eubacteriaceae bacterium]|jgi:uroporphyrinogen-III decarboxylase|nr:uroporphyrinogen decarboxylase [Eubacteriaceae bacterium]